MLSTKYAPVCLFVYNRPDHTIVTLNALRANYLAKYTDLYVFSDGAKDSKNLKPVSEVREISKKITGFKSITVIEKDVNCGLANSIISGVGKVLAEHGKVIVLEDDIVTSKNFLDYMNQALDFYQLNSKIFAISGFNYPWVKEKAIRSDVVFGYRSYSWGWATWSRSWALVDWEVSNYQAFKNNWLLRCKFNHGGSDLFPMLKNQMEGKIDSWMIRWVFAQFCNRMFDVRPVVSKVINSGFGDNATHTVTKGRRYATKLDPGDIRNFVFPEDINVSLRSKIVWMWLHSRVRRAFYKVFDRL